jgi:hypothetical protein
MLSTPPAKSAEALGMISLATDNLGAGGGLTIDDKAGTIDGVSIITSGMAKSHGFEIDGTMLQQVLDAVNAKPGGVKSRLGHPDCFSDGTGTLVGSLSAARLDGNRIRGKLQLGEYAAKMPNGGNARDYLLGVAREHPQHLGLSIVFSRGEFVKRELPGGGYMPPLGRVKDVHAVDFVDDPAANNNGLLRASGNPPHADSLTHKDTFMPDVIETTETETDSLAAERSRVSGIKSLGKMYESLGIGKDFVATNIASGATVDEAKDAALSAIAAKNKPVNVEVGEDANRTTLSACTVDAIALRAGVKIKNPHPYAVKLASQTFLDIVRLNLKASGLQDADFLTRTQLAELVDPRVLADKHSRVRLAQGTSDFGNILANVMNKSLSQAYNEQKPTWSIWARQAFANDFKDIKRVRISDFPNLEPLDEDGELRYVTMSDSAEVYALSEYQAGVSFTHRAMVSDDLDAFGRTPMLAGIAARRREDDAAYGILTANAAMADTIALFHASHNNLAASGGPVSVANLDATEALIRAQTTESGGDMELQPKVLLVPDTLLRNAQSVVGSPGNAALTNPAVVNPFKDALTVVGSARLRRNSATAWYLIAGYDQIDTVEVCFLRDEPAPVARQEIDFDSRALKYAITHAVAAKAIDFRGMAKNPGV